LFHKNLSSYSKSIGETIFTEPYIYHDLLDCTRMWGFTWKVSDCEELVGVTWRVSDCEELSGGYLEEMM